MKKTSLSIPMTSKAGVALCRLASGTTLTNVDTSILDRLAFGDSLTKDDLADAKLNQYRGVNFCSQLETFRDNPFSITKVAAKKKLGSK